MKLHWIITAGITICGIVYMLPGTGSIQSTHKQKSDLFHGISRPFEETFSGNLWHERKRQLAKRSTRSLGEQSGNLKSNHTINPSDSVYEKAGVCKPNFPHFYCNDSRSCFKYEDMCNGYSDCVDWSDECGLICGQTFICPSTKTCLSLDRFCDGTKDCENGEDEIVADDGSDDGFFMEDGSFVCSNKRLLKARKGHAKVAAGETLRRCRLPHQLVCDGIDHCGDNSDECNERCSNKTKFNCGNGKCIAAKQQCDGIDDCGNGADECTICQQPKFRCNNDQCIPEEHFCNGKIDCKDESDEIYALSGNALLARSNRTVICDNFRNQEKLQCVLPPKYVCDGYDHCYNREDECFEDCPYSFICDNGNCVLDSQLCDHVDNCGDMSDECHEKCNKTFTCNNGRCLSVDRFCDGVDDCEDGSDEIKWDGKDPDGFYCQNRLHLSAHSCKLPDHSVCDGIDHCYGRKDECQKGCKSSHICDNGTTCIPRRQVCDGLAQCKDKSDDLKATTKFPAIRGFKCKKVDRYKVTRTCVIPQEYVGDDTKDCINEADLCKEITLKSAINASHSVRELRESTCVKCISNPNFTISKNQVCDGVFDCPDLSDECLCHGVAASSICTATCFNNKRRKKCLCPPERIPCLKEDENTEIQCVDLSQFCDGIADCRNGADERHCGTDNECVSYSLNKFVPGNLKTNENHTYQTDSCVKNHVCTKAVPKNRWMPQMAVACDGKPECYDLEDECSEQCTHHPPFCAYRNLFGDYNCPEEGGVRPGIMICNGEENCADGADERNCPGRFYCASGHVINIPIHAVCDHTSDCEDQSDEIDCTDTHFYCEGGSPLYVQLRNKFDGKYDCLDGSDECPSDFSKDSWFSSREKMIENTFLNVMVWVMGILSVIGNTSVVTYTLRSLCATNNRMTNIAMIYSILVLNLAAADLIMGLFLLILGAQSAIVSGNYCRQDKPWRSGTTCTGLGIMATISSETSVAMLAILSSYRLMCVVRPIKSRDYKVRTAAAIAATAWLLAFVIAIIPVLSITKEYFITDVWLSPNPYFASDVVNKSRVEVFLDTLASYTDEPLGDNSDYFNWNQLDSGLEKLSHNYKVLGYFGYYSTHAVCLSKIFVTKGEPAWEYSFVVTTMNFLIFIYIVAVYVLMWRPKIISRTTSMVKTGRAARNMQKRIAVLVASDFACWVPTCMIAFLRLAGADISDIVYALAAIILLPINSALNPILYSNACQGLFDSIARILTSWTGKMSSRTNGHTSPSVVHTEVRTTTDVHERHEIKALKESRSVDNIDQSQL